MCCSDSLIVHSVILFKHAYTGYALGVQLDQSVRLGFVRLFCGFRPKQDRAKMDLGVYHPVCLCIHLNTCICMETGALFIVFSRTYQSMYKSKERFTSSGSMCIAYARSRSVYVDVVILNVFIRNSVLGAQFYLTSYCRDTHYLCTPIG